MGMLGMQLHHQGERDPAHQQTTISGNLIPAPPALSLDMRVRAAAVVAAHRRGGARQLSGHCYHGTKRALAHLPVRIQRLSSVDRRFALQMITDLCMYERIEGTTSQVLIMGALWKFRVAHILPFLI